MRRTIPLLLAAAPPFLDLEAQVLFDLAVPDLSGPEEPVRCARVGPARCAAAGPDPYARVEPARCAGQVRSAGPSTLA